MENATPTMATKRPVAPTAEERWFRRRRRGWGCFHKSAIQISYDNGGKGTNRREGSNTNIDNRLKQDNGSTGQ